MTIFEKKKNFLEDFKKIYSNFQLGTKQDEVYLIRKERHLEEHQVIIVKVQFQVLKDEKKMFLNSNIPDLPNKKNTIKRFDNIFLNLEFFGTELKPEIYENWAKQISERISKKIRDRVLPILNRSTFLKVKSIKTSLYC